MRMSRRASLALAVAAVALGAARGFRSVVHQRERCTKFSCSVQGQNRVMEEIVLVLTTFPEDFDADSLARELLEARLAACINVLPAQTSTYRWKGAIESARERQMVIKTISTRIAELRATLRAKHPYDLPEFLVVPVSSGDSAYMDWIRESSRL